MHPDTRDLIVVPALVAGIIGAIVGSWIGSKMGFIILGLLGGGVLGAIIGISLGFFAYTWAVNDFEEEMRRSRDRWYRNQDIDNTSQDTEA